MVSDAKWMSKGKPTYCGWTKPISRHQRNPGMIRFPCKYQKSFPWILKWCGILSIHSTAPCWVGLKGNQKDPHFDAHRPKMSGRSFEGGPHAAKKDARVLCNWVVLIQNRGWANTYPLKLQALEVNILQTYSQCYPQKVEKLCFLRGKNNKNKKNHIEHPDMGRKRCWAWAK